MASGDSDLKAKLAEIAHDGIDAFIVVRPDVEGDMWGPQGLALIAPSGDNARPLAWADYEIDVVDARTLKTISHASSRLLVTAGGYYTFPGLDRGADVALDGDLNPTPPQLVAMRRDFSQLVSLTLMSTVNDLGFSVPLPLQDVLKFFPTPPHFDPPTLTGPPRTVAVVSAIGDTLAVDDRSAGHRLTTSPIASWNLDSEIEARLTASLARYVTVKPAQADRAQLAKINLPITQSALGMTITGLKPSMDVQAYVVVLKHQEDAPAGAVSGLTLSNRTPSGGAQPNVAASYAIAVVDARTLHPVWIQGGSPNPNFAGRWPASLVDTTAWPQDGATLSPDQAKTVHQKTADLMGDSVNMTVELLQMEGVLVTRNAASP
jgi:hypothetical protein